MDSTEDTAQSHCSAADCVGACRIAGLALKWLMPLPFLRTRYLRLARRDVFVFALALFAWAIVTITRGGSNVPTNLPTTTIVETGPYRFTRNPIDVGMCLGLIGLAIAFDNLWLLMMLVPFALVIRYGVVAREEAYLERKFGDAIAATARAYGAGCSAVDVTNGSSSAHSASRIGPRINPPACTRRGSDRAHGVIVGGVPSARGIGGRGAKVPQSSFQQRER